MSTIQLIVEKDQSIAVAQTSSHDTTDHVPANVYQLIVTESPLGVSYSLKFRGKTLPVPEMRYGDHAAMVEAVVQNYDRLNPPTGAICVGLKGSGKTVLCNDISNRLLKTGIPVILIEAAIKVEHIRFIMGIVGPCVMFFDEFGKHYTTTEERNKLLAMFSDASYVGYVFLITANRAKELSDFILDRPGRFNYRFEMNWVDSRTIKDFFAKHHIGNEKIRWLTSIRERLSFDVLIAMKNALRTSSTFPEFVRAVRWLNVPKPEAQAISFFGSAKHLEGLNDPDNGVVDRIVGEIEGEYIKLRYVYKGEERREDFRYIDENGFVAFEDRQPFASENLLLALDVAPFRTPDTLLAEGTSFYKYVDVLGTHSALPSRFEDTADVEDHNLRKSWRSSPEKNELREEVFHIDFTG